MRCTATGRVYCQNYLHAGKSMSENSTEHAIMMHRQSSGSDTHFVMSMCSGEN
jgi:hypothetical protein